MELEDFEKLTKDEQVAVLLNEKKDELSKKKTDSIVVSFNAARKAALEAFDADAKKKDTDAEANWMKVKNQNSIDRAALVALWSAKENAGYDLKFVPETTINEEVSKEV